MTPLATTTETETAEQKVQRLLAWWHNETDFLSSSTAMTAHPAYQAIIAMGQDALPSLFRELEQRLDGHLSKALRVITGADPIALEDHGKIRKIAETWLRWAKENGYRW